MKTTCAAVLMILGMVIFSGCASMHVWPEDERSAESKMVTIEQRIGDGLKTGELTPDQAQMYLTNLKDIRIAYTELRNKPVYQEDWNSIHRKLDVLGDEINRAVSRTPNLDVPTIEDRIARLQRNIDDGRMNRRLPVMEERDFQARLDAIRRDYFRMTESGRSVRYEDTEDISRRLDSLARDMGRFL